jgi:hypothetical protein
MYATRNLRGMNHVALRFYRFPSDTNSVIQIGGIE